MRSLFNRWIEPDFKWLSQFTSSVLLPDQETWVVCQSQSPTVDFYFSARAQYFKNLQLVTVSQLEDDRTHPFWKLSNCRIILVRDIPIGFLKQLHRSQDSWKYNEISWFFDDDIPNIHCDKTIPLSYQKKLSLWFKNAAPILKFMVRSIYVSTEYLAGKYNLSGDSILPPLQINTQQKPQIKCFYHGSSSHVLEWQFIIKFIEHVQLKHNHIWFELIGDHELNKQVRHIPRVSVLHPMSWQNYQVHISSRPMDIGLAPLLDTPFNRARSHTKLLDIQRQGAVGLFSDRFPFADKLKYSGAGIISEDGIENWQAAFDQLINSDRLIMLEASRRFIDSLPNGGENSR